jgi:hypothetical protein
VDPLQQVEVAQDEGALGHDAQAHVAVLGDELEEAARDAGLRLSGLVGVGGRAQRDALALLHGEGEPPRRLRLRARLHVHEGVEGFGRGDAHELVRVRGVAIPAAHRAAAVGIHGPRERHARREALVEEGA